MSLDKPNLMKIVGMILVLGSFWIIDNGYSILGFLVLVSGVLVISKGQTLYKKINPALDEFLRGTPVQQTGQP